MNRLALLAGLMLWLLSVSAGAAQVVRLAVTTSFENSGLADVLVPAAETATGLDLQLVVVGTGQALRLARAGDVDAALVHAPGSETAFVADGHATHRRQLMYNDFVVLGPADDPAGLASATDPATALARIASAGLTFVSRGDDSGTHQRERALWQAAGGVPEGESWYLETGQGMGAALNTASALSAHILSDRASWLSFGNPGELAILYEGHPDLFNQYSLLPVSPARHPHVKAEGVAELETWLTGPQAAALIDGYEVAGQRLFTFNATAPESP